MRFNDFDTAWRVWTQLEAVDWRMLPFAGGLLDQPEALMDDVFAIAGAYSSVKKMNDNPNEW